MVTRSLRHTRSPLIVGVIDLLDGRAVHARGGERARYQPFTMGGLADGDAPGLARVYVEQLGLTDVYLADLNAIAGQPWQCDRIRHVAGIARSLWLDAGIASPGAASRARALGASRVVVGLETLGSLDALHELCAAPQGGDIVLSLDLRGGAPMTTGARLAMSPPAIAAQAEAAGVRTIVVLDVARVGIAAGCDVETVAAVRTAAPSVALFAGGGVRDAADVRQLVEIGCEGVLAATALMRGTLRPSDTVSLPRAD
jgi:phosphoribosylformimino-5-aminoimidazole carboxamide ribotide isomerase